jgi:thioredoxin reductase (NADPH)
MPRPIILAVDDDASVLEAVVQDLRRHYGQEYRILRAASGQAALDACRGLHDRGGPVALVVSDQRMPGISGVELLEQVQGVYPKARRVLLTAYADTEAAIRAINSARIHYYLTKPWDPPEDRLYPVLDDLLGDWKSDYKPPFEGIRVVGPRWSLRDYQIRNFLSRNQVPYVWLDPQRDDQAVELLRRFGVDDSRLPAVLFPDGSALVQPQDSELAEKVGLRTQAQQEFYDLVVAGAGMAGLAAAVYGASEGLKTLVLEPEAPGGQAGSSSRIENYLGFPRGVSGERLARDAYDQARKFGAEFVTQRATSVGRDGQYRQVCLAGGAQLACRVALIAVGVCYRRIEAPGIDRLTGAGVYYGASLAEARACGGESVYVVGGANSAGQAAMQLSHVASQVTMLVRSGSLEKSMSKYLIDQIARTSNIKVETNTEIVEALGDKHVEALRIRSPRGEETRPASSIFLFIGAAPQTEWLPESIMRDANGFVLSGRDLRIEGDLPRMWQEDREPFLLETSMPGVFVAGDVRHGSIKRAASAVGEGSIAVQFMHQYLAQF